MPQKHKKMKMDEALEQRLRHLRFKRLSWMFETLVFIVVLLICFALQAVPTPWREVLVTFQTARFVTELVNHFMWADKLGSRDPYILYPFI